MVSSKKQFPVCDAAMVQNAPGNRPAGPLLFIVQVFGHFVPSIVLRQGDKAQALTLRLLEETEDIMDEGMHGDLQAAYHYNYVARLKLMNDRLSITKYGQVARYRTESMRLYTRTVASSEYARNKHMADKKGKTFFPRLRLSNRSNADLSIITADRDDEEDHISISESFQSLPSTADSNATTSDSGSVGTTAQEHRTFYGVFDSSEAIELQSLGDINISLSAAVGSNSSDDGDNLSASLSIAEP